MTKETREEWCPTCGGEGSHDTHHPMWGSRSCPEPYIWVRCEHCDGTGKVEVEIETEEEEAE